MTRLLILAISLCAPPAFAVDATATGAPVSMVSGEIALLLVLVCLGFVVIRRIRFKKWRQRRSPSHYTTKAYFLDRHYAVVLNNVSRMGAQVDVGYTRQPGQHLTLLVEGRWLDAKVMWASGGRFGLQFSRALTHRELRALQSNAYAVKTRTAPA